MEENKLKPILMSLSNRTIEAVENIVKMRGTNNKIQIVAEAIRVYELLHKMHEQGALKFFAKFKDEDIGLDIPYFKKEEENG